MSFDPIDFGLKKDYLYEVIATSYSITNDGNAIKPNAACMGIRMVEDNMIQIKPFYSTSTYQNLKINGIITLNFIDNVYIYALAALKDPNSQIGLVEFPPKYYVFKHLESLNMDIPYIRNSWGILTCKVFKELQEIKREDLGEIMVPVFRLEVISCDLFEASHKLFNRAENLALEIIILTTRLKIAKANEDEDLSSKIYSKIMDHFKDVKRFGKNKQALKTIELVNKHIGKLMQ
ncbi:MAG: DUF447 domain-containing protein [Promethearchaeota archaeon]|jgi:hypothetical protein